MDYSFDARDGILAFGLACVEPGQDGLDGDHGKQPG
jgi:hypothetical protein